MKRGVKSYLSASAVLIGGCIGAGVLGIPYVAAQAGVFVAIAYIILIGTLICTVNLFLGEVALGTKGDHQLSGYVNRYLGSKAKKVMEFAVIFGIYAGMIAYMIGMGNSLSYLIFGNTDYSIYLGVLVGFIMAWLIHGGLKALKKFERLGVGIILVLLVGIIVLFIPKIVLVNLLGFNYANILLPFGIVLFALMSFHSIPDLKLILKRREHLFKSVVITGTIVSVIFYSLFTMVVVGVKGIATPEISTLTLGPVFILMGMLTMFTSYMARGNELRDSFRFDDRMSKRKSWILATIVPIGIFIITQFVSFFSFTVVLSLGGVVSGGIIAILILLMVKKAKNHGNRIPEYRMHSSWIFIGFLILIFVFGVVQELFSF